MTKGGHRPNSGRKPIDDKKVQIIIYVKQSRVNKLGGKENTKSFCEQAIENEFNKTE